MNIISKNLTVCCLISLDFVKIFPQIVALVVNFKDIPFEKWEPRQFEAGQKFSCFLQYECCSEEKLKQLVSLPSPPLLIDRKARTHWINKALHSWSLFYLYVQLQPKYNQNWRAQIVLTDLSFGLVAMGSHPRGKRLGTIEFATVHGLSEWYKKANPGGLHRTPFLSLVRKRRDTSFQMILKIERANPQIPPPSHRTLDPPHQKHSVCISRHQCNIRAICVWCQRSEPKKYPGRSKTHVCSGGGQWQTQINNWLWNKFWNGVWKMTFPPIAVFAENTGAETSQRWQM